MSQPDLGAERTALAKRRSVLGLVVNGVLLLRLGGPSGVGSGVVVLVLALFLAAAPRRLLPVPMWAAIVTAAGVLDLIAIVSYHG